MFTLSDLEKKFCWHQKGLTKVWKSSKTKFKMTISKFWSLIIQNLPKSMAVWLVVQFLFNKYIIYIEIYLRMMSDLLLRQVWKRKTPDLKIWDLSRIKSKIQKQRLLSIFFLTHSSDISPKNAGGDLKFWKKNIVFLFFEMIYIPDHHTRTTSNAITHVIYKTIKASIKPRCASSF